MSRTKSDENESKKAPTTRTPRQSSSIPDAFEILIADHKAVKNYFQSYQKLVDQNADSKELIALANKICIALSAHAQIEEDLLYPMLRTGLDTPELINEAAVEHATVKSLIAQIMGGKRRDPLYDAKVKVLAEYVEHHVKEEEGEMFPKARKLDLDLNALSKAIAAYKVKLGTDPQFQSSEAPRESP